MSSPLSLKAKTTSFPQVTWTVKLVRVIDEQADGVSALGSMIDKGIAMLVVLSCFVAEIAAPDEPGVLTSGIIAAVLRVPFED